MAAVRDRVTFMFGHRLQGKSVPVASGGGLFWAPAWVLRGLALFLIFAACSLAANARASGAEERCPIPPDEACIETPAEYREFWDSRRVACVDPSLYVTVPWGYDSPSGGTTGDTHLYPEEFSLAWANGSTNLEKYLELRCLYADEPMKVRVGIESYVGFPVPISNKNPDAADFPVSIFVYKKEAVQPDGTFFTEPREQVRVPSFETWAFLLERTFGLVFDLEVQKEVVLAYSALPLKKRATRARQPDVVSVFTDLTGCKRSRDWARNPGFPPTEDLRGCSPEYRKARTAAGGEKVVGFGGPTTVECIQNFMAHYEGTPDAAAFRGLLELCQDANALNTGVGLGYNPMPNPFVCKPWKRQSMVERYTGREFIVPNGALIPEQKGTEWEVVTLEPVSDARYDLRSGYCKP